MHVIQEVNIIIVGAKPAVVPAKPHAACAPCRLGPREFQQALIRCRGSCKTVECPWAHTQDSWAHVGAFLAGHPVWAPSRLGMAYLCPQVFLISGLVLKTEDITAALRHKLGVAYGLIRCAGGRVPLRVLCTRGPPDP